MNLNTSVPAPKPGPAPATGWSDRMRMALPELGVRRPWLILAVTAAAAVLFMAQFPKVAFDNDPENMLAEDEAVRVFHRQVKARYSLYDFVIVGIVNDRDPDGIFNVATLGRVERLTRELLSLRQGADGRPIVTRVDASGATRDEALDLSPTGWWARTLAAAFSQDANRLFTAAGASAIVGHELIAPSVVDNIKQADLGSLKLEYLMERPPQTRAEALVIRDDAKSNPLYNGTLVSEDGKAVCIYIPLVAKTYSYNVSRLVETLTRDWDGEDRLLITGQPVAQDTFGVEMLMQMATSAPLAALAIFVLMYFFFRRLPLIIAPMLVAMLSVIAAMGLLIGLGYDVHIMSSMIAIFLMPIAVADSIHILSEFFDSYHRFNDKAQTIRHVMRHLFMPMFYTSLTTIAGFASLATTPIPPVRVFGLHVAFGVTVAWLLTMAFVPAYIMIGVSRRTLERMTAARLAAGATEHRSGMLARFLERTGRFAANKAKLVLVAMVLLIVISAVGVTRIRVNDNPVKWFTAKHPIRVADEVLNRHFGGTYTAYLTFAAERPDTADCMEKAQKIKDAAQRRFGVALPEATQAFLAAVDALAPDYRNAFSADINRCFVKLVGEAERIDAGATASWQRLSDTVNYLDPDRLTRSSLAAALAAAKVGPAERNAFADAMAALPASLAGAELQEAALAICDRYTALSFRDFVFEVQAELTAPLFKRPDMLRYVASLQRHLARNPVVGKTSSAVDALSKASYELRFTAPPADADAAERAAYAVRNAVNRDVPETAAAVGQVFTQLEGMKRKESLFHMVTRDYQQINVWVQLKSGDNVDMESVVRDVRDFMAQHPPPVPLNSGWAGLTYLNVVWQEKMVSGMFASLASSFIVVLVMMVLLFRSPLYGALAMIPLSVTILAIYGLIGWVGKDYDMPIAVLSALTLGLSVDFSIHFLERAREEVARAGSWAAAVPAMFREPATAISRNAITIAVGFTPLLVAPLIPYRTVGFFLAAIMALSWLATLIILPALLSLLGRRAFKGGGWRVEGGGLRASQNFVANFVASFVVVRVCPCLSVLQKREATMKSMICCTLLALAAVVRAEAPALDADAIMAKANQAFYYAGEDGRATVEMAIRDAQGGTRTRTLTLLRRNEGENQKFYVHFKTPADVRNMAFLVWKRPDGNDDRWLFLPALNLEKRIAPGDKRTSFAGSDFFYEDVSGRSLAEDTRELVNTTDTAYVVLHKPVTPRAVEFDHYKVWIDKTTFLPMRSEYYSADGKLTRTIVVEKVETIDGIPTVLESVASDLTSGSSTRNTFSNVRYGLGLNPAIFTQRFLRRPPREATE